MMIKLAQKISLFVLSFAALAGASLISASNTLAAPRLFLDPAAAEVSQNANIDVKVQIDVETLSAFGSDAILNFNANDLEVVSVTSGGFFSDFTYSNPSGRLELHGYFSAIFESKSGSGTLATVKFKAKKASGATSVTFTCTGSGNDTQILNSDGDNILACGSLNQSNITVPTSGTTEPTATASATATPNNNNQYKICGGSCGSHNDCEAGLWCYQGVCRNPACSESGNCVCSAAGPIKTPTPRPRGSATPKPSPTPQKVILEPYTTSAATPTPSEDATPSPEGSSMYTDSFTNILLIFGIVVLIAIVIFVLKSMLGRGGPPKVQNIKIEEPETEQVKPPFPGNTSSNE